MVILLDFLAATDLSAMLEKLITEKEPGLLKYGSEDQKMKRFEIRDE